MSQYLSDLLKLRREIKERDRIIERIMPDCIHSALTVMGVEEKNRVVYRNGDDKITLTLVKKLPTIKEHKELNRIHEQIIGNKEKLAQSKAETLAALNLEIASTERKLRELEEKREELLTNKRIITLKSRFIEVQEESSYLKPTLNVYLL